MNEILIKNSKLKLTRLSFTKGDSSIYLDESLKKNLKYQEIYFISRSENSIIIRLVHNQSKHIGIPSMMNYEEAWVLERTKTKNISAEPYDEAQSEILRYVIVPLTYHHVSTAEIFIQALGDIKIQKLFYESYGDKKLRDFQEFLLNYETKKDSIKDPKISNYSPIYQNTRRYSVFDLIDDLVKDKADILTDSELIGKYLRISSAVDTGAKFVHEKWSRITGKLGNKRRANMSLTFMGKVKVNIPENEFDIEPGDREFPAFRSVCLIKDGSIWMPKIGVRLHSKKLIQKLRMLRVISEDLLFDGEYTLDLTKLPVVNRNYTRKIDAGSIFYPEIQNKLAKIAISYLDRKIWMKKMKLKVYPEKRDLDVKEEVDKKKEFLKNLGIYDDEFYPVKYKTIDPKHSYSTTEIERKIVGLPEDFKLHLHKHINKGKCSNVIIEKLLAKIDKEILRGKDLNMLREYYINFEKTTRSKIIENNFRLILNKNLTVKERKREKKIESGTTYSIVSMREVIKGKFKISSKEIPV